MTPFLRLSAALGAAVLIAIAGAGRAAEDPKPPAADAQLAQSTSTPGAPSAAPGTVPPNPAPPPQRGPAADPWPRQLDLANGTMLVYQPQVQTWQDNRLDFRAATALLPHDKDGAETYGVIYATAMTTVDKYSRTVYLDELSVYQIRFPTLPDNGRAYLAGIKQALPGALPRMSLDRLQSSLAASGSVKPPRVQVDNTPPRILVSYGPALLIPLSGAPVVRAIANTRFERVINTQALIVRPRGDGAWYLHVFDGWMSAPDVVAGPWTQAGTVPANLDDLARNLARAGQVDLLDGGPNANPKPSLASGVPAIHVATVPTELVVFKGQPNLTPVTGTRLLFATNTAGDVFVDTASNYFYLLIAGRWYTAPGLAGPWSFVPATGLPPDFARIPPGSPAGAVLASVPGTPQSQEALIANAVPQTAAIPRLNGPTFNPSFDGAPRLAPIAGTPLQYVPNSGAPVIRVDANTWYAVTGGVWFVATAATGPWSVAASVPEVIYTIPPTSPLHYVTYVKVYGATPTTVYAGYTPGYLGTVVSPDGVVVYGTGYAYTPWIGDVYYPPPVTYGVAAAPVYNPAVGFTFGFATGMLTAAVMAPFYGGAYYHPGYYGYPCCGSASANVYRSWGTGSSSGTRTWYSNPGGAYGTQASGTYQNRGTTGSYEAGRSYNPSTGQAQEGYARTATTAGGASGSVERGESYNTSTGQRSYASSGSATGAGGDSVSRNVSATAGPQGDSRNATTTTYNAKTGETRTWNNGVPSSNNHYADENGNVHRSTADGGMESHTSEGWQRSSGSSSTNAEQQARETGESRSNAHASGSGGLDRTGSGESGRSGSGERYGESAGREEHAGGSSFADRYGGGRGGYGRGGGGFRGRR